MTYRLRVSPSTRLRVLPAALSGLLAVTAVGLVVEAGSSSARPAVVHQKVTQRYLTALVNKKEVVKGKKVTIHGVLDAPGVPACASGVELTVERSTKGAIYDVIDHVTTDSTTGAYSVSEKVTKKSRFRISVAETADCSSAQSPPRTVKVLPKPH